MKVDVTQQGTHDHANARQLALLLEELCRLTPAVVPPAGPDVTGSPPAGPARLEPRRRGG